MEGRDKNLLAYEIWTDSKYVETVMMLVDDRGKIILPATTVSKWREGVGSLLRFAPQDDLIARSGGIAGGVAVSWYGTSDGKIVRHVVSVGSAGDTDGNVANGYGGGDDDDSTTAATTATATSTTRTTVTTSTATSTTISTTTATATTTTTTTVVDDVADKGVGAGATNTNGGSVVVGDANADDDDDGLACKAGNHGYIADGAGAIDRSPQMSSSTTAKMSGGQDIRDCPVGAGHRRNDLLRVLLSASKEASCSSVADAADSIAVDLRFGWRQQKRMGDGAALVSIKY